MIYSPTDTFIPGWGGVGVHMMVFSFIKFLYYCSKRHILEGSWCPTLHLSDFTPSADYITLRPSFPPQRSIVLTHCSPAEILIISSSRLLFSPLTMILFLHHQHLASALTLSCSKIACCHADGKSGDFPRPSFQPCCCVSLGLGCICASLKLA